VVEDDELEAALARLAPSPDPRQRRDCLGVEDLAAYLEGSCPVVERARLEQHLASCGACQDELVGARRWLDVPSRAVPREPQRQARGLAGPGTAPPGRRWLPLVAGIALASAAVPFLSGPPERPAQRSSGVEEAGFSRPVQRRGGGFARRAVANPRHFQVTGSLRLTTELRALIRPGGSEPAAHAGLLAYLEASRLGVSAAEVSQVEIAPELFEAAAPAGEVEVTLDAGGRLVLRRAP
jgi:hypothetical protein